MLLAGVTSSPVLPSSTNCGSYVFQLPGKLTLVTPLSVNVDTFSLRPWKVVSDAELYLGHQ